MMRLLALSCMMCAITMAVLGTWLRASPLSGQAATSFALKHVGQTCRSFEAPSLAFMLRQLEAADARCMARAGPDIVFVSGLFRSKEGDMPVLILAPLRRRPRGTIVFLVGGPGDRLVTHFLSFPSDQVLINLVQAGFLVALPGYSGTAYGSVYPKSDLPVAVRQIVEYVSFIRRLSDSSITVLGGSAGAFPAYLVARRFSDVPAVLLSPPLSAPKQIVERLKRNSESRVAYSRVIQLRQRKVGRQLSAIERPILVSEETRTASFFGRVYNLSLIDLFNKYPSVARKVTLLVGTKDSRIGIEQLTEFRNRYPAVDVSLLPGIDHMPTNTVEASRISDAIYSAIARTN